MIREYLKNQYDSTLGMLRQCIEQFDDAVWLDPMPPRYPAWQIAYHAIFFANIYCAPSEKEIVHWPGETQEYHNMGKTPYPPHEEVITERTYTRAEMLEFLDHVSKLVPTYLEGLRIDEDCWPFWYKIKQLEFHINSLRHVQYHIGQLVERQSNVRKISINWR